MRKYYYYYYLLHLALLSDTFDKENGRNQLSITQATTTNCITALTSRSSSCIKMLKMTYRSAAMTSPETFFHGVRSLTRLQLGRAIKGKGTYPRTPCFLCTSHPETSTNPSCWNLQQAPISHLGFSDGSSCLSRLFTFKRRSLAGGSGSAGWTFEGHRPSVANTCLTAFLCFHHCFPAAPLCPPCHGGLKFSENVNQKKNFFLNSSCQF